MTGIVEELRDSISAARYSADSVLASLAASVGLSILLFILFIVLRRRIQTLYASRPNAKAQMWPYPGNGLFSWVKPVYRSHLSTEIQPRLGLDAAVYLRFIKMLRNIFLGIAFIGCGVGIPINVYFNWKSQRAQKLSKEDAFILMTPTLVSGTPMAAHIAVGWVCNTIVILNLYFAYKWILGLRRDYYADYTHRRETVNRTVLVVDVDKRYRAEKPLASLVSSQTSQVRPVGATVGRDVKRLEELMAQHRAAVLSLEKAILKNKRETSKGKYTSTPSDSKVDHWTTIRDDLEAQIGQERFACRKENKPMPYGFVSYPTQNQAHEVARDSKGKSIEGAHIRLAPAADDIIWPNIALGIHKRRSMKLWINLLYTGFMFLWFIPVAALGCFVSNFKRVGVLWPAFAYQMEQHPAGFAILQGIVAPTLTALVFALVPILTRKLSNWEGSLTRTDREKEVVRKLFILFFLVNFFAFTFMGVIWDIVAEVISIVNSGKGSSFNEVWDELKLSERFITAIIDISSFWVMYLLRSITELFTSLAQILSLLMRTWQKAFTNVTPRERLNWIDPEPFPYATSYIWAVFYAAIALALTTVQPLVLAINAVYFTVALPFKKYELMYMYYTKHESNGLFWPVVHNIMIFSAVFGNLVLLLLVWVQANWKLAMGVAPLPIITIGYKIFSYFAFDRHYWFFIDASDNEKMYHEDTDDRLDELYENPVLYRPLEQVIIDRPDHIKERPTNIDDNTLAEVLHPQEYEPKESMPQFEYTPPHSAPPQYPEILVNGAAPFSPSTCPYPERAMFTGSSSSLVNEQVYRDDQGLLRNDSVQAYGFAEDHDPYYEHSNSSGELSGPHGQSGLRYHGSFK